MHEFTCQSFDQGRGGGVGGARVGVNTRVIVEYEQKGDQAKSTALEIYFFQFCRSRTQETLI